MSYLHGLFVFLSVAFLSVAFVVSLYPSDRLQERYLRDTPLARITKAMERIVVRFFLLSILFAIFAAIVDRIGGAR